MEIISIIAIIFAIIAFSKTRQLEAAIKELQEKNGLQPISATTTTPVITQPTSAYAVKRPEKNGVEKLLAWYAHEWPLKTGALFMLLGFGWLVSYAFLNNWIGPVGRITLGLLSGILILFFGERRLKVVQSQGITLVGLGALITLVTVFAAQNLYQMFPPFVALVFIVLIMGLTAMISLKYKVLSLAVASLVIGGIAPLLIGSTEKNVFGLYSYLLALTVGIIWIARYSKWRILTFIGLIIVTLYSLEYFVGSAVSLTAAITPLELFQLRFFALTFTSLFFFNTLSTLTSNKDATKEDLQTAAAIGIFTMGWINGLVSPEYKGIVCMMAAILYSGASFATFTTTKIKNAVYIYTAIATFLLAAATAYQFEGPVLITAFAIQALVLPIIGVSLLGVNIGRYLLFYFVIPVILSFEALVGSSWRTTGVFDDHFYSISIVAATLLVSGIYFYSKNKEKEAPLHQGSIVLVILGSIYGLVWIWRLFEGLFTQEYISVMAVLVVYSLLGLGAYVYGEINKRTVINRFGLGLLIFVIGRLLIVEIWNMELSTRIITFFLIGLLFIGSVLLRKSQQKPPTV